MKDYYSILGIDKNSTKEDVKKSFRQLAQKHHPDKKGGDEKKFKEISEAYGVLSDDKKRAEYDQFGSYNSGGGQGFDFSGFNFNGFNEGGFDGENIFETIFGGRVERKAKDIYVDVEISFKESIEGINKKVSFTKKSNREKVDLNVNIPAGIFSGQSIRYRDYGEVEEGKQPGDLLIRIYVREDGRFRRENNDIITDLKLKISDVLLGSEKVVELWNGESKNIKIPIGIKNGDKIKIKGMGVKSLYHGDMYINIVYSVPKELSKKEKEAAQILRDNGN